MSKDHITYRIDEASNTLSPIEITRMDELPLSESIKLEDWVLSRPEILEEELLIIQKNFQFTEEIAEFDDNQTGNQSIDLLALNTSGELVIIVNAVNSKGEEYIWSALKLAHYASYFSADFIVETYQDFLNQHHGGGDAYKLICLFIREEEFTSDTCWNRGDLDIHILSEQISRPEANIINWVNKKSGQITCHRVIAYSQGSQSYFTLKAISEFDLAASIEFDYDSYRDPNYQVEEHWRGNWRDMRPASIREQFWEQCIESIDQVDDRGLGSFSADGDNGEGRMSASSTGGIARIVTSVTANRAKTFISIQVVGDKRLNSLWQPEMIQSLQAILGRKPQYITSKEEAQHYDVLVSECDLSIYQKDSWPTINQWVFQTLEKLESLISTLENAQ